MRRLVHRRVGVMAQGPAVVDARVVASAEQASQQRSRVATEEPRVTELH